MRGVSGTSSSSVSCQESNLGPAAHQGAGHVERGCCQVGPAPPREQGDQRVEVDGADGTSVGRGSGAFQGGGGREGRKAGFGWA